jgi:hypothetical protein
VIEGNFDCHFLVKRYRPIRVNRRDEILMIVMPDLDILFSDDQRAR